MQLICGVISLSRRAARSPVWLSISGARGGGCDSRAGEGGGSIDMLISVSCCARPAVSGPGEEGGEEGGVSGAVLSRLFPSCSRGAARRSETDAPLPALSRCLRRRLLPERATDRQLAVPRRPCPAAALSSLPLRAAHVGGCRCSWHCMPIEYRCRSQWLDSAER